YFDVTDYSPVLKGNKQITMSGGGQWQEDMDVQFLFIVGTPPRNILEMQQIWRPQSKGYGAIIANDAFEPRDILMHPNASAYKLRTTITGHGQEGEFIPQNHYLNIDGGAQEYVWSVWTECADNPVYPQGGTWIYDRAGWCPGKASDLREDDLTQLVNPGQTHNIDYGISSATGTSNYWVSSQLVSYDNPNFIIDASIAEILSPTTSIKHFRRNPMCSKPEIVLQNTGSSTLTSVVIKYWINGGQQHTYNWSGSLDFLEKAEIELPDPTSLWSTINTSSSNKFYVEIFEVNSATDEYSHNNLMTSEFEAPESYPNTFSLWFETNSGVVNVSTQESESSWKFLNSDNSILFSSSILYSNTQYRDTLTFDDGCYTFIINDEDDDGFDFWANNDGSGMARFRELGAGWLHAFDGDFGKFIFYEFKVESSSSSIEQEDYNITIYPNPSRGDIIISGDLSVFSEFKIVDNLGKVVLAEQITKNTISQKINIKSLAKGIYFIEIDDCKIIRKIVKQ
ncbi:MAG: peptide-N-glycosidase F-related protein, partial [Flavobacteriales bacterium]